jgi:hypothetical protein
MSVRLTMALVCVLGGTVTASAQVFPVRPPTLEEKLAAYLTPDGRLRGPLEVRDEKGGFGVFAGMIYHVDPNGQWTITEIVRRQPFLRNQGLLTRAQLKKLAEALVRYDLLNLPNVGTPKVNPHVLTIAFGGRQAMLTFGIDQVALQPDPTNPNPGLVSRYGGIAGAVRGLLQAPPPQGVPVR